MDNKEAVSGETENTADNGGVKYQARDTQNTEDKYFARQIDKWDGKDHGGSFRVGKVSAPLLAVGVPDVDIWFDHSKAAKQLEGKSEITKDIIKQIPTLLANPIAISESYDNTVMVFGELYDDEGRPIVVALRVNSTNRRNHVTLVNKVRSVGTRTHNLDKLLSDESIVYLSENKKETTKWFNALGRSTPFGGTKFGLIRSIAFDLSKSNTKKSRRNQTGGSEEVRTFREQTVASGRVLTDVQEKSIFGMERLAALLGIDMYVYESYVKDGERVYIDENGNEVPAPNGYYRNGKIYVDLNAGDYGEGTMLYTVSHEVVHLIRQWNPAKFHVLADCVVEGLAAKGESISQLIKKQEDKAAESGEELSFDDAYEEMVADALEGMLADGSVIQVMAEIRQRDKTLWEKIRDFFADLLEDLKMMVEAYSGYEPNSKEGKMVAEMQDLADKLRPIFAEAALEAADNYNAAAVSGETKNTADNGGVKYQARRLTENDLDDYLKAGTRRNKNKMEALARGEKIILTTENEVTSFIDASIDDIVEGRTVAYGMVNDRLAQDVHRMSNGTITISDNYLELVSDDLRHSFSGHQLAKQDGDINLSREDFERIPEYLDSYTELLYAEKYTSGKVSICVSKILPNGRILIIETVSKSRGALQFKNAIGVSEQKYQTQYLPKYKEEASSNTGGSKNSNISPRDDTDFNTSISNTAQKSNTKNSRRNPNAQRTAAALERENARLKDDVKQLRELVRVQKQVTGGTKVVRKDVDVMAKLLMKNADAKGDYRIARIC